MILNIKHLFYILVFLNSSTFFGQINDPPTVTAIGDQIYCPLSQQPIVTSFNITDPDDTLIPAFYIQISSGYVSGQDQLLLTGSHPTIAANWDANQAKLTLTGVGGSSATYADMIAAVYDVVFNSTNINVGPKTFSLTAGSANYLASTGHYYDFIPANLITWTAAKAAAEALPLYFGLQGYLATLTNADEAQIAGELTPGTGWIGGTDEANEGVWKWATGPEAGMTFWNGNAGGATPNYANWNSGEPNNSNNNEDYAHIKDNSVPGIDGTWNDLPNNTTGQPSDYQAKGFVIEYGGTPGDPVLNISASTTFSPPQILSTSPSVSCGNDPANLSATSNTNDILWYDSQNGGALLHTGDTYNPVLTTNTTFWVLASNNGCTTGTRTAVTATVNSAPTVDTPANVSSCDSYTLPTLTNGDYFTATNGGGTSLNAGDVISASTTLFVYAETATTPNCTSEHPFDITINTTPTVDTPADISSCDSYTLPVLTNGNYYTATNGGGTQLNAGEVISTTTPLFVYAKSTIDPNCTNEHPFSVTINATPTVDTPADVTSCDSYTLPALTIGKYFTAPNGGGTQLNAGEVISATTTLYVYAETGTTPNCSDEHDFDITIITKPVIDTPGDVIKCDNYTLPAITNGNYYTATNGGGTQLNAGEVISTTTPLFVYAESTVDPSCTNEHPFTVTINATPTVDTPADVTSCDSYTLPALTVGKYFTAPNGGGTQLSDGEVILTSVTLFVYEETGTTPNCSDEYRFNITIDTTPAIDTPADVFSCESYTLPALTVGNYFTLPDGGGTLLNAGDILSASTPLYVYGESPTNPSCNDQHVFNITINPTLISILSLDAEVISEDFEDNQTIVASATGGNGDYEYQLDGGSWQNSGVFENVFGCETHTVRAREVLGCSTVPQKNINLVYFPKFFTPNGDGYNDTWNIKCLKDDPTAVISIFDRFGKLLFQFSPNRSAWNGTFNGSMLTGTDYWFLVTYLKSNNVQTEFRSHFSMRH
ncbi:T9SS type B sorting domain-containing protein [Flavobacteriaceae bacterium]|nr:T9SS type B sorting domain-containing protein [Flavobacteriaceae bacterium]